VVVVFGLLEVVLLEVALLAVGSVWAKRAEHISSVPASSATILHFPRSIRNL
jgi:hypothetical protein